MRIAGWQAIFRLLRESGYIVGVDKEIDRLIATTANAEKTEIAIHLKHIRDRIKDDLQGVPFILVPKEKARIIDH
jgi:hypothetical protein